MYTSILPPPPPPHSPLTKVGTESTFSTHSAGLLVVTCGCLFLQLSLSTGVQDRAPGNTTQCIQRLASLVQGTWQHHTTQCIQKLASLVWALGNTTQCIQGFTSLVQGTWQHHTMYTGVYQFSTEHLATTMYNLFHDNALRCLVLFSIQGTYNVHNCQVQGTLQHIT